eukprot:gnl/TRDRNA2_/TRDRNA2_175585_c9_seq3.p1 gnl/TRDRNA2_/TRDRNA2_175585_c9~~gnl/TRDRNA2_/TRDRNA2_175585_c9_seq3.p1  ORF type:complete len:110 (-),score=3.01 gnl/TRDRNA2_/TRDRNA2_175585_c9_seq3:336-665(-)
MPAFDMHKHYKATRRRVEVHMPAFDLHERYKATRRQVEVHKLAFVVQYIAAFLHSSEHDLPVVLGFWAAGCKCPAHVAKPPAGRKSASSDWRASSGSPIPNSDRALLSC